MFSAGAFLFRVEGGVVKGVKGNSVDLVNHETARASRVRPRDWKKVKAKDGKVPTDGKGYCEILVSNDSVAFGTSWTDDCLLPHQVLITQSDWKDQ